MKKILISLFMLFILIPSTKALEETQDASMLDAYLEKIAPNGIITMKTPKSFVDYYDSNDIPFYVFANYYIKDAKSVFGNVDKFDNCYVYFSNISENLNSANLNAYCNGENYESKTLQVTLKWQDENVKGTEFANNILSKISSEYLTYAKTDLDLVKYLMTLNTSDDEYIDIHLENFLEYSNLSKFFNNNDVSYYAHFAYCHDTPLSIWCDYEYAIENNGVYYAPIMAKHDAKNHIYIPDETENTPEAYIEAAKIRIDNYFGSNDIKIEKAGLLSDASWWEYCISDGEIKNVMGDITLNQIGDYYYYVTINGNKYNFLIARDSSKITEPMHITEDAQTGVSIKTTSSEVPMDTVIEVEVINKETEIFKSIIEKIKTKIDEVMVFDLKLFSKSKNSYITKISTGEFIVSVPIIDILKGKELVAYYITDDGKIEEHPVTVENGIATFTTNHFSIYTIAEKQSVKENVPNTYDGISVYFIILLIGIMGMATALYLNKQKN